MNRLLFGLFAFFFVTDIFAFEPICRLDEPCTVAYKTIGCFKDFGHDRVLPNYIYNERDPTVDNYGNRNIDWFNWENYMAGFSCRCAKKAEELGYDLFGVQFYGECWAGKKNLHFSKLTKAGAKCVGDGYVPCPLNARYCAGEQWSNFVYEIVNTTCEIEFVKEGCFADNHDTNARPLANYVLNDRDPTDPSYSGQNIDWINWDVYLPQFACRCAKKAKESNSTYFGLQYYGECWTHPQGSETYARDGHAHNCVNKCYKDCKQHPFCMGVQLSNYVYRIKGQQACDVEIEPVGCYKEDPSDRVLGTELVDAKYPSSVRFYGQMADTEKWAGFFPDFLCKCAHEAKIKGLMYFGVSEFGKCYTDNISENYAQLGNSTNCYEGKQSRACGYGSMACAGADTHSNYVYKIPSPS